MVERLQKIHMFKSEKIIVLKKGNLNCLFKYISDIQ